MAHGLFAKHMVAFSQSLNNRLKVHTILGGNEDAVRKLVPLQDLFPAFHTVFCRNVVQGGKLLPAVFPGFCNTNHFQFGGVAQCIAGIDISTALTCTKQNSSNLFHS